MADISRSVIPFVIMRFNLFTTKSQRLKPFVAMTVVKDHEIKLGAYIK